MMVGNVKGWIYREYWLTADHAGILIFSLERFILFIIIISKSLI